MLLAHATAVRISSATARSAVRCRGLSPISIASRPARPSSRTRRAAAGRRPPPWPPSAARARTQALEAREIAALVRRSSWRRTNENSSNCSSRSSAAVVEPLPPESASTASSGPPYARAQTGVQVAIPEVEQETAPVDRCAEAALAFWSVAITSCEHVQRPLQPLRRAHAGRARRRARQRARSRAACNQDARRCLDRARSSSTGAKSCNAGRARSMNSATASAVEQRPERNVCSAPIRNGTWLVTPLAAAGVSDKLGHDR